MRTESNEFALLKECPFCNETLNHSEGYFCQVYLSVCSREKFFVVQKNILSNTEITKNITQGDDEWNELFSTMDNAKTWAEKMVTLMKDSDPIAARNIAGNPAVLSLINSINVSAITSSALDNSKIKEAILKNSDDMFNRMIPIRSQAEQQDAARLAEEKLQQLSLYDNPMSVSINTDAVALIKSNSKKLQEYFLKIINTEKNIRSVKQRLLFLYSLSYEVNRKAKFAQLYPIISEKKTITDKMDEMQSEFRKRANEISELERQREYLRTEKVVPPSVSFPVKPIEPTKPIYAAPNFFNKKKITAENEAKAEKYNNEIILYNKALAEYPVLFEAAKRQQEDLHKKAVEDREKEILALDEKIAEKTSSLEKFKNELETQQAVFEAKLTQLQSNVDYPEVQLKMNLDKEISTAEELLSNLFRKKNQLYGADIVFGKYRDLAAITSFYEYLLSGRCETLDGVNGCYNLYETELRANIIINKLDVIGDSLEQIKSNQYMLYSQLSDVNAELNTLNATTTAMLNGIRDTAEVFLDNSNVIAYNSAVTAYYSKLNAEIASSDRYISMICW